MQANKIPIVLFASGSGSNAKAIWQRSLLQECNYTVAAVYCNNPKAGIIDWCMQQQIPVVVFDNSALLDEVFLQSINVYKPKLIVLAGFLRKIPGYLVAAFPQSILNIHPALLPKYGGKGMYGHFVHEAVAAAQERESGITIHYVNEQYDEGAIILQKTTALATNDSAIEIAAKVLALEHTWYWQAIEMVLMPTY
jgi:phosphoribosylglycinamide formyltransferase 1